MTPEVITIGDWKSQATSEVFRHVGKAIILLWDDETGQISGATNVSPQLAVLMMSMARKELLDR